MQKISIIFFTLTGFISLALDQITVYNETDHSLYVAAYYHQSNYNILSKETGQRATEVILIKSREKKSLIRPSTKVGYDRDLLIAPKAVSLKPQLTRNEYHILPKLNVGALEGNEFYIALEKGIYKGYTALNWNIIKPTQKKVAEMTDSMSDAAMKKMRDLFKDHQYARQTAQVRLGSSLSSDEKKYLEARRSIVKTALEKLTGLTLSQDEILRIGLVGSGGGYRAMVCTLGSVIGADHIGLLNGITYFAALSGSTWMLAPWTIMGNTPAQFRDQLIPRVKSSLFPEKSKLKIGEIAEQALKKFVFGEPITLIDIYGALLGRTLLGNGINPYNITLGTQTSRVANGSWVYPIYTAVVTKTEPYEWVEFTPYEIGSDYLGGYVPSWAFGRKFEEGKSITFAPPQALGFYMGIWGSAFSANFQEIYKNMVDSISPKQLREALQYSTETLKFGSMRVMPAKVFNFTHGLRDLPRSQEETLTLVDAGLSCNLPAVPLLRKERAIDVLIFLDASQFVDGAPELKCVEAYARKNNIKFPAIDYKDIGNKTVSVFKSEKDRSIPTVIYMPRIKNGGYSKTFDPSVNIAKGGYARTDNFVYTPEQVRELSGLTEFNMKESKDAIAAALRDTILARRQVTAQANK